MPLDFTAFDTANVNERPKAGFEKAATTTTDLINQSMALMPLAPLMLMGVWAQCAGLTKPAWARGPSLNFTNEVLEAYTGHFPGFVERIQHEGEHILARYWPKSNINTLVPAFNAFHEIRLNVEKANERFSVFIGTTAGNGRKLYFGKAQAQESDFALYKVTKTTAAVGEEEPRPFETPAQLDTYATRMLKFIAAFKTREQAQVNAGALLHYERTKPERPKDGAQVITLETRV